MNDSRRFDIIVTIKREGGTLSDLAYFAVAARRTALNEAVGGHLMFAWTAEKVITSVAVAGMPDESAALAAALGVVSDALRGPGAMGSSRREATHTQDQGPGLLT